MCSTYITRVFANKNGTAFGLVISVTYDAKFCRYDLVLELAIIHPHPTPKKSNFKSHDNESNIPSSLVLRGTSGCEQAYIGEDKVGKEKRELEVTSKPH